MGIAIIGALNISKSSSSFGQNKVFNLNENEINNIVITKKESARTIIACLLVLEISVIVFTNMSNNIISYINY